MGRIVKLFTGVLMLIGMLGVFVYVTLQNQDIRNKAGRSQEYLQLTPLKLLKKRWAITRVVVNNLQENLYYRLVLTVTYTPNPDHLPPQGTKPPGDKKRTLRIRDNKTYAFLYRLQTCYFVPQVTVKMYSREKGKRYQEVPITSSTTTELTPPCATTKVQPSPIAETQQQSSESGSQGVSQPIQPEIIELTNGDIPEDAGEDTTDSQAIDLESIEEISAMETESNNAPTEIQSGSNPATPTPQSQQIANKTTIQSSATPTSLPIVASPTSYPTIASIQQMIPTSTTLPTSTIPALLPSATPSITGATPTIVFLQTILVTPTPQSNTALSMLLPSPEPTDSPIENQFISTQTAATNEVPFYHEISTPTDTQLTQQSSFGSLAVLLPTLTPTPSGKNTKFIGLNAQVPTPTPKIRQPPLSDFAARSYAENNATPTPFPLFNPNATTVPTPIILDTDQNPFVPEVPSPTPTPTRFSLFDWLSGIIAYIIQFFITVFAGIKQLIQSFFG